MYVCIMHLSCPLRRDGTSPSEGRYDWLGISIGPYSSRATLPSPRPGLVSKACRSPGHERDSTQTRAVRISAAKSRMCDFACDGRASTNGIGVCVEDASEWE